MKNRSTEVTARTAGPEVQRGVVVRAGATGVVVRLAGSAGTEFACDLLETEGAGAPRLHRGDRVLLLPPRGDERAVVLGRIVDPAAPERRRLVLQADDELVIQCGAGSITIRKNGKVLIQGLEIVSHARGKNRIRGGSIQLN